MTDLKGVCRTLASGDGTGGNNLPLVHTYSMGAYHCPKDSDTAQLTTMNCSCVKGDTPLVQAVAIAENIIGRKEKNGGNGMGATKECAYTQNATGVMGVAYNSIVRRLMPIECERLMGFPDNYTQIPWRGKPKEECPDSHRYKVCGNSMCVNVMEWIGRRIDIVEKYIQLLGA